MLPITVFPGRLTLAALLLGLAACPAQANTYVKCAALVNSDPNAAYDAALEWEATDTTGGALHCGGLALAALGLYDAAAERFQRAAQAGQKILDVERATLYRQAGDAWLLADRASEAIAAFTEALRYVPEDPALLFGRARAYDLAGDPVSSYRDINQAIDLDPSRGAPYLMRARLNRQLKQLDAAHRDIETALATGVDTVPVRLERGLLRYEQGDFDGAREDWRFVKYTDIDPEGEAGAASITATRFIETLETQGAAQGSPTPP